MLPKLEKVLVAMSGGVDSSVAAALLLEAGHEVVGVFMRNGVKPAQGRRHRQGCCGADDAHDARRVADRLGIPFYAIDMEDAFETLITEFVQAYRAGVTPNPCIECNRRFKMGAVLDLARRLGAHAVATGHYASIVERNGRLAVERGADRAKDQSYVLFSLEQDALRRTRLPLGQLTKGQVRREARRLDLPVAEKPESMEICFVPTGDYRDLIRERVPEAAEMGAFVDASGRVLGRHGGTAYFTIGQRRGLPGGQREPLYVTAIDPVSRTVTVGPKLTLLAREFVAEKVVWSGSAPLLEGTELRGEVMIRAHHRAAAARTTVLDGGRLLVRFERPEPAVTPGQAAVLYQGDRIVVGGWIAPPSGPGAVAV